MSEDLKNNIRLSKAAKEFNISPAMIVEFLGKKGHKVDSSPNTKLNGEMYALLVKEYQGEKEVKKNADQLGDFSYKGKSITIESARKNGATLIGAITALLVCFAIDRKFVNFDTHAVWWVQILKAVVGLALLMRIKDKYGSMEEEDIIKKEDPDL